MTEKEKMLRGMIYDANNDAALIAERLECKELIRDYNDLRAQRDGGPEDSSAPYTWRNQRRYSDRATVLL